MKRPSRNVPGAGDDACAPWVLCELPVCLVEDDEDPQAVTAMAPTAKIAPNRSLELVFIFPLFENACFPRGRCPYGAMLRNRARWRCGSNCAVPLGASGQLDTDSWCQRRRYPYLVSSVKRPSRLFRCLTCTIGGFGEAIAHISVTLTDTPTELARLCASR